MRYATDWRAVSFWLIAAIVTTLLIALWLTIQRVRRRLREAVADRTMNEHLQVELRKADLKAQRERDRRMFYDGMHEDIKNAMEHYGMGLGLTKSVDYM